MEIRAAQRTFEGILELMGGSFTQLVVDFGSGKVLISAQLWGNSLSVSCTPRNDDLIHQSSSQHFAHL